jgi:hypothetical protein
LNRRIRSRGVDLSLFALFAGSAVGTPATYTYASWSSAQLSNATTPGSASGSMTIGAQTISISYSGDVTTATQAGPGGIDYYVPATLYTNSQVANVPTNNDLVALGEAYKGTNTVTFSSPLLNPILDIVSLGAPGTAVTYNFNATPVILSQGPGYWGGCASCLSVTGNSLRGTEGSGIIEFLGSYDSLSWTTTGGEYWNGFTVGVQGLGTRSSSTVPEPATFGLFGMAGVIAAGVLGTRSHKVRARQAE